MELLKSKIIELPIIYFITNRNEIKDLPIGVPFIYGDITSKEYLIRILEYEVLYQKAIKTGFPFNFKQLLKDAGYKGLKDFEYSHPAYMEFVTKELIEESSDWDIDKLDTIQKDSNLFKKYIRDTAVYVDITVLKDLKIFPIWLNKIEEAINTNIHNFAVFNNNMYNKKLEGMYGSIDLVSPNKNLIIIDISSSIPKGVSSTCLALSKNLAETFYADLLITGSKSTLYSYEEIYNLDINTIYEENGEDNDQTYFKRLVTGDERSYKTAIVFGDNHSPCYKWSNRYNKSNKTISREDGQEMCKWKIDKLISLHVEGITNIAGYADWFKPSEVEKIEDWVKYLNK